MSEVKKEILNVIDDCNKEVEVLEKLSDEIVLNTTKDLDELMNDIQENVVIKHRTDMQTLQDYFLELTMAVYYLNSRCDRFGFFEDVSKLKKQDAYNKAYSRFKMDKALAGEKVTISDTEITAENSSYNESVVSTIYSRSNKIIRGKVDSACEMIRTLSKIISIQKDDFSLGNYSNTNFVGGLPPRNEA